MESHSPGAEEEFYVMVRSLKSTRDSIQKATKFALSNADLSSALFRIIMKRMAQVDDRRRIPLFYLLDSICQVSKKKNVTNYCRIVSAHIEEIVEFMISEEAVVHKVLGIWERRQIMPDSTLRLARQLVDEGTRENTAGRNKLLLRKMERDRRETKRRRLEAEARSKDILTAFAADDEQDNHHHQHRSKAEEVDPPPPPPTPPSTPPPPLPPPESQSVAVAAQSTNLCLPAAYHNLPLSTLYAMQLAQVQAMGCVPMVPASALGYHPATAAAPSSATNSSHLSLCSSSPATSSPSPQAYTYCGSAPTSSSWRPSSMGAPPQYWSR